MYKNQLIVQDNSRVLCLKKKKKKKIRIHCNKSETGFQSFDIATMYENMPVKDYRTRKLNKI